jgi:hypothetical protein
VQARAIGLSGEALIDSSTSGPGQGGTVTVTAAETLTVTGRQSSLRTNTAGSGRGGDLVLQARTVRLAEGAVISAQSSGRGTAGTIRLQIDEMFQSDNAFVTTASTRAGGGAIVLRAERLVWLRDSALTTSVQGGGGDAGNITLDAPFVIVESSQIIANAFAGMGGNLHIGAAVFLADPASRVEASSALGIDGEVEIQALVTNLSEVVAPLVQPFAPATGLLQARCAERLRAGGMSSFVLGGREGVPAEPEGGLPSPLVGGELETVPLTGEGGRARAALPAPRSLGPLETHRQPRSRGRETQARVPTIWGLDCPK